MATRRRTLSMWHVLLIDDDPLSIALVEEVFARYKANVYAAASGPDALLQLERMPRPTAILSDVMMPQMNGFILLNKLRNVPHMLDVPIIAVTAQAMSSDRERILSAGFDGYISKPFCVATFVDEIIGWMETMKRS